MAWRIRCSTSLSLVRDPEAAARYAADPAAAIADAHLAGVTSADVDNLIPMVADSMAAKCARLPRATVPTDGGNVWTTGAATAAFDAFGSVDHQVQALFTIPAGSVHILHDVSFRAQAGDRRGGAGSTDQSGLDQSVSTTSSPRLTTYRAGLIRAGGSTFTTRIQVGPPGLRR